MDVQQLVGGVQSANDEERGRVEAYVQSEGVSNPESLLNALFTLLKTASVPDSQAAILLVKNLVVSFWSPAFGSYKGPTWPESTKHSVRSALLSLIAEESTKPQVRQAADSIVARIAGLEYPDQWPEVMPFCLDLIYGQQARAGLSLFKELLNDTVREQDFWQHGMQLMERLYAIISTDKSVTQLYALQCFHECMNFFLMGENDSQLASLEQMAASQLGQWNALFVELLKSSSSSESSDIVHELIDTLQDLQSGFPEIMAKDMPQLLGATFEALKSGSHSDRPDVVALKVDFLEVALNSSPATLGELRSNRESLDAFVALCVDLSKLGDELQELWVDDFNEFVTHEQELSIDVWPRPSVGTLVGGIKTEHLLASITTYLSGDWVEQEAALYLLSCALQQHPIESQQFDPSLLVEYLASTHQHELLQARVAITAGHVAKYYFSRLADPLPLCAQSLDKLAAATDISALLKCAHLKTASLGCKLFAHEFKPHQALLLQVINSLISEAEEETPSFLVDCFLDALRLDFDGAIQHQEVFSMFFALVAKGTANIELNVEILELVGEFMDTTHDNPAAQHAVVQQLLTPVLEILRAAQPSFEYSSDLQFALDICGVVFERCTVEVIKQDKQSLVQMFETLVLECEEPQILQAGSFAYAALMEQSNWSELSQDEIQQALQVTAKLLHPDREESAALAAGRLITALLANFSDLGEVLGQVFVAAAKRQLGARHAYLVESLGLAFADLFIRDAASALDLLDSHNILGEYIQKWLQTFEVVRGADELLKFITALQHLFDLGDPRLTQLIVDDEAITRPDGIPLTRSKGLKFTKVPFPLKAIKLLVHTLEDSPMPLSGQEEDDEWTDEVIISMDGSAADGRVFPLIMDWFKQFSGENMHWYQQLSERDRAVLLKASRA